MINKNHGIYLSKWHAEYKRFDPLLILPVYNLLNNFL